MFYIQIALSLFLFFCFSLSKSLCPIIPHCLQCIDDLTCIKCRQGFKLESNVCVFEQQKIKRFLQTKSLSQNPEKSSTPATNLNALTLPSNKNADNFTSFQYFSNPNQQPQKDTKCLYQSKGVCYICGDKYQMGSEGQCYPKFNKCLSFNKNLLCNQCHPHFQYQKGSCVDGGCSVKNYYQCKDCKKGYILNKYFYCIVQFCNQYQNGKCTQCQNQFTLKQDICVKDLIRKENSIVQQPIVVIEHCIRTLNNKCLTCDQGFYLLRDKCKKVPFLCKIFDFAEEKCRQCKSSALLMQGSCFDPQCTATNQKTQQCSTCAVGYILNGEKVCQSSNKDQNCINKVSNMCTLCRLGYFINNQGKCEKFPDNCLDKQCMYCRNGYISIKNKCQKLQNCQKFITNICQKCQSGYSVTEIGTCIKSVDNCLKYSPKGCENCPDNYFLSENSCVLNKKFQDPNCIKRNFRSECSLCKLNFRLQPKYKNLCVPNNRQCRTSSMQGICTSCYQGYKLNELTGDCIIIKPIQNCADQADGICKKCAPRYYLASSESCRQVDSLCDGYSQENGLCTSCYYGYALFEGRCLVFSDNKLISGQIQSKEIEENKTKQNIQKSPAELPKNQISTGNCLKKDKSSNKCLKCYDSFILNPENGLCIAANPLCKTHSVTNGSCLSCYEGYKVLGGSCVLEQKNSVKVENRQKNQQSYKLNCKKADDRKKQCVECLDRYYKSENMCREVSPQCKSYNVTTGACLSCYTGYIVKQRQCVVLNNVIVPVQNCQQYDQNSLKCTKCSQEYMVRNNLCERTPLGCFKYDQSKDQCAECIEGYVKNILNVCVVPALGEIKNCSKYDESGYCAQCSNKWILQNYMCSPGRSR